MEVTTQRIVWYYTLPYCDLCTGYQESDEL
jgi:hypothetical protein